MLTDQFFEASKFEVTVNVIVITKAITISFMPTSIQLKDIEDEQKIDLRNMIEIARIMKLLRDIEQD